MARDLVIKMLRYPPSDRVSAKDAYSHEWIQSKKFNELKPETAQSLLTNLKNFHVSSCLLTGRHRANRSCSRPPSCTSSPS